ncbi:MAG: murein biosynthesis integral membrane protein MurJ [Candidatus Stahlbacteria bacterium]|nr:murein biosynthesis integral membrane protein MurJ [Candidatus Stahlbacteria bacterium]
MKAITILKDASGFAFGTTISRVLGFIREMMFAYLFGAGMMMDVFRVAFRIPNLLRDLLAEGTLTPAFLPMFSDSYTQKGKKESAQFMSQMIGAMLLITGGITIIGIIFAPIWVKFISFGFTHTPEKYWLTVKLTRIMFPFLIFISIAALVMGINNFFNHFFIAGAAPSVFNIAIIGCGLLLSKKLGIQSIAIGALLGGALQFIYQSSWLHKDGYTTIPKFKFDKDIKRVFALMLPISLGYGAGKINVIVNTQIASFLGHGVISWLSYAFELMFVPVGIIGVALENVTLPFVSKEMSAKNKVEFKDTMRISLVYGALASIVVTIGIWVFATPICRIIYQHGSFTAQDTLATASALKFYCIGIPGLILTKILATGFYALKDTKKPMIASFVAVAVNVVLSLTLVRVLSFKGIALAASLSNLVNTIILWILLKNKIFTS